jgi:uncharacterized protein YacL
MTVRNFKQLFSIVSALILGSLGLTIGILIRNQSLSATQDEPIWWIVRGLTDDIPFYLPFTMIALCTLGILVGTIIGPMAAEFVINTGNAIERMSTRDKVAVGFGTFIGVVVTFPFFLLSLRAPLFGIPLTVLLGVAFVYLGIRATMSMKDEFRFIGSASRTEEDSEEKPMEHCKILDTNVIIDGRIADICRTKFVEGPLYVPGFVLDELQHIADSSDSLKRARGRRGLDILNAMQKDFPLIVRSYDHLMDQAPPQEEVDTRLVRLAKLMGGVIITNDFNLNKVAALQGVVVLNVNELANALKPVVLPGEEMQVTIIREGKEQNQGVAYLDDGTMIVVEDGRRRIGECLDVIVTSVLQTVAGKMIFARMKGSNGESEDSHDGGRGRPGSGPRFKVR